jgi:transcriptional regulator with XRE-family HTH domain
MMNRDLEAARKALRLTRKAAAALVGVHPLTVGRWELGRGGFLAHSRAKLLEYCLELMRYAKALGKPGDDFRPDKLCPGEFPEPGYLLLRKKGTQ